MTARPRPAVIVADDEPALRATLGAMLTHLGYEPLLAPDGIAALDLLRLHCARIAVVVLDVRMPGMDGRAAFRAMRALAPDLPYVFLSGDTDDETADVLLAAGATAVLYKPIGMGAFGRALADVVGRGRA